MTNIAHMGKRLFVCSALFLPFLTLLSCGGNPVPPELEQGMSCVAWMLQPAQLNKTGFPTRYPIPTAKVVVSFLFSDMGRDVRPPTEGAPLEAEELEMAQMLRIPFWPKGVQLRHTRPDPSAHAQLVMTWDDERGVIIVEGYMEPGAEAVVRREFEVPKVQANEISRALSEAFDDRSYQAF